jgi:O-antigen ligase
MLASAVFGGLFSAIIVWIILCTAIWIFMIISQWKVFEKAWLPGWGILIPFYNIYLMFKLWGRPGGWTRWILFPPVLVILMIIVNFDIAKRFNKHRAFGLGLWILPIVFFPILAFDKKSKRTSVKK